MTYSYFFLSRPFFCWWSQNTWKRHDSRKIYNFSLGKVYKCIFKVRLYALFKNPRRNSLITLLDFLFQMFCGHQRKKGISTKERGGDEYVYDIHSWPLTSKLKTVDIKHDRECLTTINVLTKRKVVVRCFKVLVKDGVTCFMLKTKIPLVGRNKQ